MIDGLTTKIDGEVVVNEAALLVQKIMKSNFH
jgi:hypothetical protein